MIYPLQDQTPLQVFTCLHKGEKAFSHAGGNNTPKSFFRNRAHAAFETIPRKNNLCEKGVRSHAYRDFIPYKNNSKDLFVPEKNEETLLFQGVRPGAQARGYFSLSNSITKRKPGKTKAIRRKLLESAENSGDIPGVNITR